MTALASPNPLDRVLSALRALVRAEFPRLTFLGVYEYSVQANGNGNLDALPTDTTLSLPGIQAIPIRLPLGAAKPAVGSSVLVGFVNGDPTRPYVAGTVPTCLTASVDASVELDLGKSALYVNIAGALSPIPGPTIPGAAARMGDLVQAGPFAGTIVSGSAKVQVG